MPYKSKIRGRGQFTAPTSRSGKQYIYEGRRVIIDDRINAFRLTWRGPEVVQEVIQGLYESLFDLSDEALNYMKEVVPVDNGKLRDSCYVVISIEGTRIKVAIGAGQYYAVYVELGTRFHSAQPYIRPTFDFIKRALPSAIRDVSNARGL